VGPRTGLDFSEKGNVCLYPDSNTGPSTPYPSRHTVCALLAPNVSLVATASPFPASVVRDSRKLINRAFRIPSKASCS
jgi:hypothetical protein